jgi:hypothetical protein
MKIKKYTSKGYVEYLILIIAVFGFILVNGLSSNLNKIPIVAQYILTTPTTYAPQGSLQLQNLQYTEITFTPAPTNVTGGNGICTIPPLSLVSETPTQGKPADCSISRWGNSISLQNVPKMLFSWDRSNNPLLGEGSDGYCIVPRFIVIHTTGTYYPEPQEINLFNDYNTRKIRNGKPSGVQFGISPTGHILQMADTFQNGIEMAWGVGDMQNDIGHFNDHIISIEMIYGAGKVFHSISQVPPQQYKALVQLVLILMKQYHIPAVPQGHDASWIAPRSGQGTVIISDLPPGLYGHYQLNPPPVKVDPGIDFFKEFQQDMVARSKNCL